jgi:hypothetical protein
MIKTQAVQHDHSWIEHRVSKPWDCKPSKLNISNSTRCLETDFCILTSRDNCALVGYCAKISG